MKLSAAIIALSMASATAFAPSTFGMRKSTSLNLKGADMSGNTWKPDSDKMGVRACSLFLWRTLDVSLECSSALF